MRDDVNIPTKMINYVDTNYFEMMFTSINLITGECMCSFN